MRTNLIAARKHKGLTQEDVAAAIGISTRQYQRYEAGKHSSKVETWEQLQELLEVPHTKLRENY